MLSSKSNTPFSLKLVWSFQVEEYHIPPLVLSQLRSPSNVVISTSVESPGIPCSLKYSVSWARIIIWEVISSRSMDPSNSSIIGTIDTSIKPIIETTPPNNNTVATAAETASSSRTKLEIIS